MKKYNVGFAVVENGFHKKYEYDTRREGLLLIQHGLDSLTVMKRDKKTTLHVILKVKVSLSCCRCPAFLIFWG